MSGSERNAEGRPYVPPSHAAQQSSYNPPSPPSPRPLMRAGGMRLNMGMRDIHAVYLGGNITRNDWRRTLVHGLGPVGVVPAPPFSSPDVLWPHLPAAVIGRFDYVGPYSISGDPTDDAEWSSENEDEGEGSEWVFSGPLYAQQRGPRAPLDPHQAGGSAETQPSVQKTTAPQEVWWPLVRSARHVQRLVITALREADLYFAWIDTPLCAATLTEVGWAIAKGKVVWIAGPQAFDEMWLVYTLASQYSFRYRTPAEAFQNMLQFAVTGAS